MTAATSAIGGSYDFILNRIASGASKKTEIRLGTRGDCATLSAGVATIEVSMDMEFAWIHSLSSLLYLLLHLAALVLALIHWSRYPNVALLVLLGSLLNLFTLGLRFVSPMVMFMDFGFAFVNLGLSLLNVAGYTFYLIAIFAGRTPNTPRPTPRPSPRDDDVWDRPKGPPKGDAGSTGIKDI